MPVLGNAIAVDGGTTSAEDMRRLLAAITPGEGIVNSGDLAVTANGTPNWSVNVAAGAAFITGDDALTQGRYFLHNTAARNKSVTPSDPTNARKDIVVAQILDPLDLGGSDRGWDIQVLTGTPAASPVEPALPDNALKLATLTIAAGSTSVTSGAIADARVRYDDMQSYTPVWTASITNPSIGNGSIVGRYRRRGPIVDVQIALTIGSTTNVGSGSYSFSLPAQAASFGRQALSAHVGRGGEYAASARIDASGTTAIRLAVGGSNVPVSNSVPGVFASGDWIILGGSYFAA